MLSLMRKKAGSWVIKIILAAIVIVFIFWGVGSFQSRRTTQVAEVNDTIVTYDAYRRSYTTLLEQYRRIYGAQLNDEVLKLLRLDEQALDQIIYRILMLQEAERLGLKATAGAVAEAVHQIPAFQKNGAFDFAQYQATLARNNVSTEEFEKDQGDSLLIEQLRALILDGITISEAEARQWHNWQNTQINLSYLLFAADRYQNISPSEQDISAYYDEHKNDYLTDPQVKVQYLFFDPKAHEQTIDISGADVERYYYGNPDEFFTDQTVQARHILFTVESEADEQAVEEKRKKALEVYELAKQGKTSFAELAQQYSDDPSSANGGDLGTFSRDMMVKPFADKAFSMEPGEISEPVRTQFGWHIIKVEQVNPAVTQSLQGASEGISARLKAEKARELAKAKAESIYDSVFDGDDLAKVQTDDQMTLGATDFFSEQQPPDIGAADSRKFAQAALALDAMAISSIIDLDNGYYLLQVIERKEPAVPALEQIAERVKADVIRQKQQDQAKADAQAALTQVKEGTTLAAVAGAYDLEVRETGLFKRLEAVPDLGYEPEINRLGFALSEKEPLAREAAQTRQGWLLLHLKEQKQPETETFDKEKDSIVERLTAQKKQETFQNWLNDLKKQAKIDINRELLR